MCVCVCVCMCVCVRARARGYEKKVLIKEIYFFSLCQIIRIYKPRIEFFPS